MRHWLVVMGWIWTTGVFAQNLTEKLSFYDGALRYNVNKKDPNHEFGGGSSHCHGTAIAKQKEGESCRYVVLTAAHCFESPVKGATLPVEITYLEIIDFFAAAESSRLTVVKHPDWKDKQTDVALFSLVAGCDEGIPVVPLKAEAPAEGQVCGILSDHTARFTMGRKDGQFKYVSSPKIPVRLEGEVFLAPRSPTFYYFLALDISEGYLVPGDSGSGMVCENEVGELSLQGVLIMAPHVGRRYGVQSGEALKWVESETQRLLRDSIQ